MIGRTMHTQQKPMIDSPRGNHANQCTSDGVVFVLQIYCGWVDGWVCCVVFYPSFACCYLISDCISVPSINVCSVQDLPIGLTGGTLS